MHLAWLPSSAPSWWRLWASLGRGLAKTDPYQAPPWLLFLERTLHPKSLLGVTEIRCVGSPWIGRLLTLVIISAGIKFVVLADPRQSGIDSLLRKIYEIYSDFALKNPFYSLEMPIRYSSHV